MAGNEKYLETYKIAFEGVKQETARMLKENYALVYATATQKLGHKLTPPADLQKDEEAFLHMADEFIKDGKAHLPGMKSGETVSLKQLDDELQKDAGARKILESLDAKHVQDLVPTFTQAEKIATTTANAVSSIRDGYVSYSYNVAAAYTNAAGTAASDWYNGKTSKEDLNANAKKAMAEKFKSTVSSAIAELKTKNPDMKAVLNKGNVDFIESSVYNAAMGIKADPDILKKTAILPPDKAFKSSIGVGIYETAFAQTQKGINDGIDEETKKKGFWGGIANWLGADLANFLIGIINAILGMFGQKPFDYIPNANEVKTASHVVAQSVSNALAGDSPPRTQEEAHARVQQEVLANLKNNKKKFPSLAPHFEKISREAGNGAKGFDLNLVNNSQQAWGVHNSPIQTITAPTPASAPVVPKAPDKTAPAKADGKDVQLAALDKALTHLLDVNNVKLEKSTTNEELYEWIPVKLMGTEILAGQSKKYNRPDILTDALKNDKKLPAKLEEVKKAMLQGAASASDPVVGAVEGLFKYEPLKSFATANRKSFFIDQLKAEYDKVLLEEKSRASAKTDGKGASLTPANTNQADTRLVELANDFRTNGNKIPVNGAGAHGLGPNGLPPQDRNISGIT